MLRLGSRGSTLARWQAENVRARLERAHPELRVEVQVVATTGDRIHDVPLARIGEQGLFTKEIDRALLDGSVDAAVHSLKDVPTRLDVGLRLAAVTEREDPRDALLASPAAAGRTLATLPPGARVGTSSLRRRAQLLHARPDLRVEDLRGNLDTRLTLVAGGRFDAAIVAYAGLRRLGREAAVTELLEPPGWLPAVGQGALAILVREDDARACALTACLDDTWTRCAAAAERAFLRALEGGCQVPIGALAAPAPHGLLLHGLVASLDGQQLLRGEAAGPAQDAELLGQQLAADLLERGGGRILEALRGQDPDALPAPSPP